MATQAQLQNEVELLRSDVERLRNELETERAVVDHVMDSAAEADALGTYDTELSKCQRQLSAADAVADAARTCVSAITELHGQSDNSTNWVNVLTARTLADNALAAYDAVCGEKQGTNAP